MNAREVTNKIKSVSNVRKITKAMQLVSAVKMRKAQLAAIEGRPYQEFIEQSIRRVTDKMDKTLSPLLAVNTTSKKKLIIVVSSNKGLCGSFNANIFRFLIKNVDIKQCDFITIGKKGAELVSILGGNVIADFSVGVLLNSVSAAFELALQSYLKGSYAEVLIAYNKFINTLRSDALMNTILPFKLDVKEVVQKKEEQEEPEYTIEPEPSEMIEALLKSYIEEKIRFALIESEAGEHSARMIAMKNATDNASDVIVNLTSLKNKLRQQKITYELLDMVTAKESVEVN